MSEVVPEGVSENVSSQSFSVPNTVANPSGETTSNDSSIDISQLVPEAYKDKAYMQKIKDVDGLFKAFDNAQSLIGKRGIQIPTESSSDDDWNELYKQLGRPDTPDDYNIEFPQDIPKGFNINDEEVNQFKEIAHKMGLNNKQIQSLVNYDIERQKQAFSKADQEISKSKQQIDKEFDQLANKMFGEEVDSAISNARNLLNKYAPKDFSDKIANLDNSSLIALTAVLNGISKDYIAEDTSLRGDSRQPQSEKEMLSEARKMMQMDAYRNPIHVEHDTITRRVQEIFQHLYGKK